MSSAPSDRYARRDEVVTREILGETLLVPISAQIADMRHIFALNDTAAWIWQQLDGETPLARIRDGLAETFEVCPDTAWEDLRALLGELDEAGLVCRVKESGT